MRFEYAGGVLPHERHVIERFEDEIVPYLATHGPAIGERAMSGDLACEEVIRRYRQFVLGDPGYRQQCYLHLVDALKRAERNLQ